jgi:hypothetical protein
MPEDDFLARELEGNNLFDAGAGGSMTWVIVLSIPLPSRERPGEGWFFPPSPDRPSLILTFSLEGRRDL